MNNNIVDRAIKNSKIREKLHGAGIFPTLIVGPTGPTARCNKSSIYIFKW